MVGGIFITGFAIVWTIGMAGGFDKHGKAGPPPKAFLAMALIMGLGFASGGIWQFISPAIAFATARRTVYAVTNRRAIILQASRRQKVSSYLRPAMRHFVVLRRRDGSGDIVFDRIFVRDGKHGPITKEVGFYGLDDPRSVIELMRRVTRR